jgi:Glycosyl hydrolases family 43
MSQATIINFGPAGEQVLRLDVNGNAIDVHDGDLLVAPDGSFWWYGTSYGCGYQLLTAGSQWCGVRAYRSTDLMQWHDMGLMVPADATWLARCSPPAYGCYNPHVVHRPATNDYLMWINAYDNASGYHLLTAPTPGGPWTELPSEPTLAHMGAPGGFNNGAMDVFIDGEFGTGYLAYTDIARGHKIVVEQLNGSYTSGTGVAVDVTGTGMEAPALFRRGDTYYLIYGPTCEYCAAATYVRSAPSPLGPWSAQAILNSTGCGGQVSWVAQIGDTYLLALDQWVYHATNQAQARHFWTPLSFVGTAIQPYTCPQWITVPLTGLQEWEYPANRDQNAGSYAWRLWTDVKSGFSRLQTFTPAHTGILTLVEVMTFRGLIEPNAPLQIDVVRVNAVGTPVGPILATVEVTPDWAPKMTGFEPGIPVMAGVRYALLLHSASTTGAYGFAYNDLGSYVHGIEAYKSSGAWIVEPNRSLNFAIEVT